MTRGGKPSGHRVEEPQSLEDVAVSGNGRLSRFAAVSGRRCFHDLVVRRVRCRRCGVRAQPCSERCRSRDAVPLLRELGVDEAIDVSVELQTAGALGQHPDSRKSRRDDLLDVLRQVDRRVTDDRRRFVGQELAEADGGFSDCALGEAQRPKPEADDATGTGMGGTFGRRGTTGQQEPSAGRVGVDAAPHQIPGRRIALPLVQQDRPVEAH